MTILTRTRRYLDGGGIGIDCYLDGAETPAAQVDCWLRQDLGRWEDAPDRLLVTFPAAFRVDAASAQRLAAVIDFAVSIAHRLERGHMTPERALMAYGNGNG